ncbi:tetratricopeptide repeat protein [Vibrio alginolyticus]
MNSFTTYLSKLESDNKCHFVKIADGVFKSKNFDEKGYVFGQIFEPGVLREALKIHGIEYGSGCNLTNNISKEYQSIKWMLSNLKYVSNRQKTNLASFLISISRFELAQNVLDEIEHRELKDCLFDYYWCLLIIYNRTKNYQKINIISKTIIESEVISIEDKFRAYAQVIVWSCKGNIISDEIFKIYKNKLDRNVVNQFDKKSISEWYRAYSMIPAFKENDFSETRRMMDICEEYAISSFEESRSNFNVLKTAYESRLKEFLYIHDDFDKAEEYGIKLINLDRDWSISYYELSQVYIKKGDDKSAIKMLNKAISTGAPYLGLYRTSLATILEKNNQKEQALNMHKKIVDFDPSCLSSIKSGLRLSPLNKSEDVRYFESAMQTYNSLYGEML